MYTESDRILSGNKRAVWERFLAASALTPDADTDQTVTVWDDEKLIACGSRKGNLLKCIAVDPARQGEGLTAAVLTPLRQEAIREGHSQLFLYTKPRNRMLFAPLFFYPVAQTQNVLLMENTRSGVQNFLSSLEVPRREGKIGCIVMNADPFTRGHQYLAETAAQQCDWLYIFVLSEDKGTFTAQERMELVKRGTEHLKNVTVHPTGPYLISSATFPKYFLKDKETAQREHYLLDLAVFTRWFVPHFGITHRFAGTEPTCVVTDGYNRCMAELLPEAGVQFVEIPRKTDGTAAVSASVVRREMNDGNLQAVRRLVPDSTYQCILSKLK